MAARQEPWAIHDMAPQRQGQGSRADSSRSEVGHLDLLRRGRSYQGARDAQSWRQIRPLGHVGRGWQAALYRALAGWQGAPAASALGYAISGPTQAHRIAQIWIVTRGDPEGRQCPMHKIQRCYESALLTNRNLGGRLVLEWTVHPTGRATHASVVETNDEFRATNAPACIAGRNRKDAFPWVRRWRLSGALPLRFPARGVLGLRVEADPRIPLWLYWSVTVLAIVVAAVWTVSWELPDGWSGTRFLMRIWFGPAFCFVVSTVVTWLGSWTRRGGL